MTIISTYVSEDGKQFNNEKDCLEYEQTLKDKQFDNTALLFDRKGNRLSLSEENFGHIAFIVIKTDEAAEYLYDKLSSESYITPWDQTQGTQAGAWIFNNDDWENLEDFLAFAKIAKRISEL